MKLTNKKTVLNVLDINIFRSIIQLISLTGEIERLFVWQMLDSQLHF